MAYHSNGVSGGGNGVGPGSGGAGGGYSGDERESRSGGGDDRPDSDLTDKPIYLLEHLATFTVNKDTGIVYPADGMRRLLQLEKTTGIWSQKMQLCLDNQWVLIMDYETGNIIERFPASLIQEPTAFTGNDPMEMYNNILVFIVSGGSASRSEMHIFQSQSISAVHLVEDLKQLRNGKLVTQHRDTIPPLPMKQSMSVLSAGSPSAAVMGVGSGYHHESDSELGGINDETSSTSSDKYERDVTVLNHCFDDIEKFIARLQHAAAASRELERRRRNRKSKKKDPGEGLLTLRTRPPHEKEFIDIFAKFKLSFNLLAKLKAHIHDPNAPELVHFLFTPLALIVEASSDTYYESHLPGRVINPLLTREAVNLLINCVTSKETELWRSLGDAWTIPRDQWKGHIGSYHPVFFDGWSPDYPVVDELEHPTSPTNIKRRIDAHHSFVSGGTSALTAGVGNSDRADYEYEGPGSPGPSTHHHHHHAAVTAAGVAAASGNRDFSVRSDISIDSIERNGASAGPSNTSNTALIGAGSGQQQSELHAIHHHSHLLPQPHDIDAWIEDLQTRGAKIVQVTYPRTANNDKELTVVRGEYLEILDDSRKWWKARNSRGQVAHVPHTIVTPYNYNDSSTGGGTGDVFNNPLYSQNYSNNGARQAELIGDRYTQSIEPSPSSNLMPASNSADWVRNKHIEKSQSFGSESSNDEDEFGNDGSKRRSYYNQYRHQKMSNGVPTAPPPPPPPPPNDQTTPVAVHSASFPRSNTNILVESTSSPGNDAQNEMQEELKQVLTLFREKRPNLDIIKTPEIYINASSSANEVEQWLRAKGFSEKVVRKLHGLNGNHLFSLKRDTLEDFCGAEEGKRLTSQITIQRNVCGYKTARTSELQALLARARQKTEQQQTSEGTFKENIFN